jgi:hypothetical protein
MRSVSVENGVAPLTRPTATTRAPASRTACAMPRPMPLVPPVTRAQSPVKSMFRARRLGLQGRR